MSSARCTIVWHGTEGGYCCSSTFRTWEKAALSSGMHPYPPQFIVGMSADISNGQAEQAELSGMDRFMVKPVQKEAMLRLLSWRQQDSALWQRGSRPVSAWGGDE